MPDSWTDKEERMYDHIKDSEREKGASLDKSKEIAARTVNKHRREEGETENRTTQGTGNPNTGYESRSKDELYNIAKERNVEGRSKMTKDELIRALRD